MTDRRSRRTRAVAVALVAGVLLGACGGADGAGGGMSRGEVEEIVQSRLSAAAVPPEPSVSPGEVEEMIRAALAALAEPQPAPAGLTRAELDEAIAAALAAPGPGLTRTDLAEAIEEVLAATPQHAPALTRRDVALIARHAVASIPPRSDPAAFTKFVVENAISRYETEGLEATLAHYNRPESVDGQWYVFIIDENDVIIGHYNPDLLGLDLKGPVGTDANGYTFGTEMLSATGDGKWVSYVYINPATVDIGSERFGASELKNAWVVRRDGLLFGSGWHINADEFTKSLVALAVEKFRSAGLAATVEYFRSGESVLAGLEATIDYYNSADNVQGQWFAFIADRNGRIVAHYDPAVLGEDLVDLFGTDSFEVGEHGGWVTIQDTDPEAGELEGRKHLWVAEHDGFVFGSGWQYDESR